MVLLDQTKYSLSHYREIRNLEVIIYYTILSVWCFMTGRHRHLSNPNTMLFFIVSVYTFLFFVGNCSISMIILAGQMDDIPLQQQFSHFLPFLGILGLFLALFYCFEDILLQTGSNNFTIRLIETWLLPVAVTVLITYIVILICVSIGNSPETEQVLHIFDKFIMCFICLSFAFAPAKMFYPLYGCES